MTAQPKQELMTPEPPVTEASTLLTVIERAAANPAIDVEKMERLLAMQERVLARNAEQAFNQAMQEVQQKLPPIVKDAINPDNKSKYARLETLIAAITPIITAAGFSMSFGTDQSPLENHYRITCIVSHSAGHSRSYHADIPADLTGLKGTPNKSKTHAFGSTMSYGRRYLTLLIFNIATKNEDDDGAAAGRGDTITIEQAEELTEMISATKADVTKFLGYFKIETIDALPLAKLERAKTMLSQKKKAAKK